MNSVTFRLELPGHFYITPSVHVSQLKPVIADPLLEENIQDNPPEPLYQEGEPAYIVKQITDTASELAIWNS